MGSWKAKEVLWMGILGGTDSGIGGGRMSSHAGGTYSLEGGGDNEGERVRDSVPDLSIPQSMGVRWHALGGDSELAGGWLTLASSEHSIHCSYRAQV